MKKGLELVELLVVLIMMMLSLINSFCLKAGEF